MTVSRRTLVIGGVAAATALVIAANIHLVYVSVTSQPECVARLAPGTSDSGAWSAVKSSC
ncbi:MAG TPA: hypothetical protein VFS49_11760 [Croceibacterium sp.]|nr:hypothetical protein [Croceibacterium sp.]